MPLRAQAPHARAQKQAERAGTVQRTVAEAELAAKRNDFAGAERALLRWDERSALRAYEAALQSQPESVEAKRRRDDLAQRPRATSREVQSSTLKRHALPKNCRRPHLDGVWRGRIARADRRAGHIYCPRDSESRISSKRRG
jgi:hypothetical protein